MAVDSQQSGAAPLTEFDVKLDICGIQALGSVGPSVELSAELVDVMVTLEPPVGSQRVPVDVCCIVDISDSMGADALVQDTDRSSVSHGLTLLNIVQHSLRSITRILDDGDRMAVVVYGTDQSTALELTKMDQAGRTLAEDRLASLTFGGATNMWLGLQRGVEILAAAREPGRFQHICLFTDGVPNINPPRGIIPMVQRMKDKAGGKLGCTISTFGFGCDLDSNLLNGIATLACGTYSFIPDASFVGTVFENVIANLLVTMATNVTLTLQPTSGASFFEASPGTPVLGGHPAKMLGNSLKVDLGTLRFGQEKNVLVRIRVPAGAACSATINYDTPASGSPEERTVQFSGEITKDEAQTLAVQQNRCRCRFVDFCLQAMREVRLTGLEEIRGKTMPLEKAQAVLVQLHNFLEASGVAQTEAMEMLLEDFTGQVAEAFSREDWYKKWGVHYLPSLMSAHLTQQCNNFKDAGVQVYGGEMFENVRDKASDIFLSLPPPQPTPRPAAAQPTAATPQAAVRTVTSMSAFHNAYGGCIDGSSIVHMADGTFRRVAEVRKGDLVVATRAEESGLTAIGTVVAEVLCLVQTEMPGDRAMLVQLPDGPRVTPYHPVLIENRWVFPVDIASTEDRACNAVYSFVLRGGDALLVDGVPCIALSHAVRHGAARHPYFGSTRVVDDLKQFPGYEAGLVELLPTSVRRDPETGIVCGFVPSNSST